MKTTEIHTSLLKTAFLLFGFLGFVALFQLAAKYDFHGNVTDLSNAADLRHAADGQFLTFVFGLGAVAMVWLLFRPWRLLLDDEGFTLKGGYIRSSKKILWRDIDQFFVYRARRGIRVIGFNYKSGAREISPVMEPGRPDKQLPTGWPKGTQDMADMLNAYRLGNGP